VNYDGSYSHQPRVSVSSAVLLTIFVAAALIMVAIVVWRPLVHHPSTPAAAAGEAASALRPAIPAPAAPEVSSP
jgi:multidrug resistance efflux pump